MRRKASDRRRPASVFLGFFRRTRLSGHYRFVPALTWSYVARAGLLVRHHHGHRLRRRFVLRLYRRFGGRPLRSDYPADGLYGLPHTLWLCRGCCSPLFPHSAATCSSRERDAAAGSEIGIRRPACARYRGGMISALPGPPVRAAPATTRCLARS